MQTTTTRPAVQRPEIARHFQQCAADAKAQIAKIFAATTTNKMTNQAVTDAANPQKERTK